MEKKIFVSFTPQEIHHPSTVFQHGSRRLTTPGRQTTLRPFMHNVKCMLVAALMLGFAVPLWADTANLFRVFLKAGTSVVSYGDFSRVGDRLIFSMPIGEVGQKGREPRLHVVNLPISTVDWAATSKYADSVRYRHYMATRAESDYGLIAGEVAAVLNA